MESELKERRSNKHSASSNNNNYAKDESKSALLTKADTQNADMKKEKTHAMVYVVFISLLFDLLAFTIILPLLPSLLEYFKNNDSSGLYAVLTSRIKWFQELVGAPSNYNSVLFGGFLGSMFSFLQFVASPIVGGLSDYYGRKPVMIVCAVSKTKIKTTFQITKLLLNFVFLLFASLTKKTGIALSYLLWALSRNFAVFVLARFVGGLSKGNISLCMSVITDVSSEKTRGRGMALVGVAFSLGFIVGPMIGALFAIFSNKSSGPWFVLPSLLAFGLAVGDLLVLIFGLKETLPKVSRIPKNILM